MVSFHFKASATCFPVLLVTTQYLFCACRLAGKIVPEIISGYSMRILIMQQLISWRLSDYDYCMIVACTSFIRENISYIRTHLYNVKIKCFKPINEHNLITLHICGVVRSVQAQFATIGHCKLHNLACFQRGRCYLSFRNRNNGKCLVCCLSAANRCIQIFNGETKCWVE